MSVPKRLPVPAPWDGLLAGGEVPTMSQHLAKFLGLLLLSAGCAAAPAAEPHLAATAAGAPVLVQQDGPKPLLPGGDPKRHHNGHGCH